MNKPIIGITPREEIISNTKCHYINDEYFDAVIKTGGSPIMLLPNIDDNILSLCNGFIITGGIDATKFDFYVLDYAKRNNIPILGICLGMQVMAMSDGVKLQHIGNSAHKSKEQYVHMVKLNKDSFLYSIINQEEINVNSRHFYRIEPTPNYKITSISEDNIIESIELEDKLFHIGVQWHPESLYDVDDNSKKLFKKFISSCQK